MSVECPVWQQIVDEIYHRDYDTAGGLRASFTYDEMLQQLNEFETDLVLLASLNYQVQNGGFQQWIANKYSDHLDETVDALNRVNTSVSNCIAHMLIHIDASVDVDHWEEDAYDVNSDLDYDLECMLDD